MPSILFVCTANRCRSPIAMALLRQKLAAMGASSGWQVESAGTWAEEDLPVVAGVKPVLAARGIDLSEHRSRIVTREMLRQYQLILVMERGHKEALQIEFPEVANRVHLLSEMAGKREDVPDPYPMEPKEIGEIANLIGHFIEIGFERITRLAAKTASLTSPRPRND